MSHRVEEPAWYSLGVASPHPDMLNVRILCFPSGLFWKLFIKIHGLVSLLSFIRAFQNVILELTFTGCENVFWKGGLWQVYSEDWLKIERSGKGVLHSHIFLWEMCSVLCSYVSVAPIPSETSRMSFAIRIERYKEYARWRDAAVCAQHIISQSLMRFLKGRDNS